MNHEEIVRWATDNADKILDAAQADEHIGFCVACGEQADDNVEPDARDYTCSSCGKPAVYGAEELVFYIPMTDNE